MAQPQSLDELRDKIHATLKNDVAFGFVVARLMIRSGVNLKSIVAAENRNPEIIAKVTEALTRMDIRWESNQ